MSIYIERVDGVSKRSAKLFLFHSVCVVFWGAGGGHFESGQWPEKEIEEGSRGEYFSVLFQEELIFELIIDI